MFACPLINHSINRTSLDYCYVFPSEINYLLAQVPLWLDRVGQTKDKVIEPSE